MENATYCKKCSLKIGHPGIVFDEKGVCNLCNLDFPEEMFVSRSQIMKNYQIFENSKPGRDGNYDCMLMLSGGKDSIYMLDKLSEERKILAYTFDVPFESKAAIENIEKIKKKGLIDADFVSDSNEIVYKKLMQHAFNNIEPQKPGKYMDEKLPCLICTEFMVISACLYAYKRKIPFILSCADPIQMFTFTPNIDVKELVKLFKNRIGEELYTILFSEQLDELLHEDNNNLPKIVFPYVSMIGTYDADKVIEELKERGAPMKIVKKNDVIKTAMEIARELSEKPLLSLKILKKHLTRQICAQLPDIINNELEMHKISFAQPEVRYKIEAMFGN
mmetsp:Transcript_22024/g.10379  ORF Transcript_22024/g.10379 Transcript_22024/m.10379 type:complete len:333 (-) Transcript_22024:1903-2901(-)